NLSVFGNHRIGTEPAIAREIEHVGWFGEEKNVDSFFSHHFGTPLHTLAINTIIHVSLLVIRVVPFSCGYKEITLIFLQKAVSRNCPRVSSPLPRWKKRTH